MNPLDHLGLVKMQAGRLARFSQEPFEDLFQQGYLGLHKAVERFNPQRQSTFSSFAVPYIHGEILRYLDAQRGRSKPNPLHTAMQTGEFDADLFADWRSYFSQLRQEDRAVMIQVWRQQWESKPIERQTIELCILKGLKRKQAAQILNCNDMMVTRSLRSGLTRLRWAYLIYSGETGGQQ